MSGPVSLDSSVMVQDSALVRKLASLLDDSWSTQLVSWDLEARGDDPEAPRDLCVSGIVTARSGASKGFALWLPLLGRARAEQALGNMLELVDNCERPHFVAGLLRQHEQVFVSPWMPERALLHEAPLLRNFAQEPSRWSAIVAWHPQLAPGTSLVKFFPLSCQFFVCGKFLAVLCVNKAAAQLHFFELDLSEPSWQQLPAVRVEEELSLPELVSVLTQELERAQGESRAPTEAGLAGSQATTMTAESATTGSKASAGALVAK